MADEVLFGGAAGGGKRQTVQAIEKGSHNYVRLQDLRDEKIEVGYDAGRKLPSISVK